MRGRNGSEFVEFSAMAALSAGELVYGRAAAELAGAKGVGSLDASSIWRSSPGRGFLLGNGQTTWEFNGRVFTSESEYIQARIAAFRAQQTAGSIDTIPPGQRLIRPPYYDAGRVPGPNPNNLGQRVVTWPTRGQGGAYYKPQGGKTKAGSATDFYKRYGPNDPEGIQVEVPQTRHGPPPGVDNADYWTPRAPTKIR